MIDEFVEIMTENGKPTGKKELKSITHRQGICHGISAIALINKEGKILLQKRAPSKKTEPNKWDLSGAGHIALGESPKEAAIRELHEELGIFAHEKDLTLIDTYLDKVLLGPEIFINHFTYLFVLRKDIPLNQVNMQKSEVSEILFVDKKTYLSLRNKGDMVHAIQFCDSLLNYLQ